MIEDITFQEIGNRGQCEIQLQHSTGDVTHLLFGSTFPMQAKEYYIRSIQALLKKKPDLSPKDDLFNIFTWWFLKCHLNMPLGVGTYKDEERIRIGQRIKEIREENNVEAKSLALLSGVDAANISRIEQGKVSVGLDVLSKIANALGYKVDLVKINNNQNTIGMKKNDENQCTLFHEEIKSRTKTVFMYTEDLEGDGELCLNIDYDIEYSNGDGQQGNAFVELDDALKAYQVSSFKELAENLSARYNGDEKAWQKIVEEMKGKGLDPNEDESESGGFGAFMTNIK